jgi:nucleotide-binding universal stress UspA family protein
MYVCMLVSLDGSLEAEAVLPKVEQLLEMQPGRVILLSVVPEVDIEAAAQAIKPDVEHHAGELPGEVYEMIRTSSENAMRPYLEAIAKRLERTGATVEIVISFNAPADAILFFAEAYRADMIAMATHGRSGFSRLLHGSVTESVLHRAPCPMLIVRTPTEPLPRFATDYAMEMG